MGHVLFVEVPGMERVNREMVAQMVAIVNGMVELVRYTVTSGATSEDSARECELPSRATNSVDKEAITERSRALLELDWK